MRKMAYVSAVLFALMATSPTATSGEDVDDAVLLMNSMFEMHAMSRGLDAATRERFEKSLFTAMRLINKLGDERRVLLQEKLDAVLAREEQKVAQLRANGECVRAQSFDKLDPERRVKYADLRCPD